MRQDICSNFDMLKAYEPQLLRLSALAEQYFAEQASPSVNVLLSDVQPEGMKP
jgi:type I restriction enzyme R subunit